MAARGFQSGEDTGSVKPARGGRIVEHRDDSLGRRGDAHTSSCLCADPQDVQL